jgi:hypothetical protein
MDQVTQAEQHHFDVNIIAATEKQVEVRPNEKIAEVKRGALKKFGVPESAAGSYSLALTPGDPNSRLDDSRTVKDYGLHAGSTIYLVKPHTDA